MCVCWKSLIPSYKTVYVISSTFKSRACWSFRRKNSCSCSWMKSWYSAKLSDILWKTKSIRNNNEVINTEAKWGLHRKRGNCLLRGSSCIKPNNPNWFYVFREYILHVCELLYPTWRIRAIVGGKKKGRSSAGKGSDLIIWEKKLCNSFKLKLQKSANKSKSLYFLLYR